MIAVVTGSSGFIGSHVVDALLARGATVRALVRPQSNVVRRVSGVEYHEVDVLNAQAVRDSAIWKDASHVFHLAGLTVARSLAAFRAGNVQPLVNILGAVSERSAAVERVVVVSSQAAGGPAESAAALASGTDSAAPVEWYGQSKLEAEQVALSFAGRIPVSIIRPPSVYGPRDAAFLELFRQATSRLAFYAMPPSHRLELTYVSDVVDAIMLAAVNDAAIGRRYTVTGQSSVSWRELYAEVARVAGSGLREFAVPSAIMRLAARAGDLFGMVTQRTSLINSQKLTLGEQPFWLCDGDAIRRDLGWRPTVSLQQGVRETYNWYVDAGLLRPPRARAAHSVGQDSTH